MTLEERIEILEKKMDILGKYVCLQNGTSTKATKAWLETEGKDSSWLDKINVESSEKPESKSFFLKLFGRK